MEGLANGVGRSFGRRALLAFAVLVGTSCEREEYVGVTRRDGHVEFELCSDRFCTTHVRWNASGYAVRQEHDGGERMVWSFSPRGQVRRIRFGDSAYGDAAPLIPALEPGPVYELGGCSFRVVDEDVELDVKFGSRCAAPGRDR